MITDQLMASIESALARLRAVGRGADAAASITDAATAAADAYNQIRADNTRSASYVTTAVVREYVQRAGTLARQLGTLADRAEQQDGADARRVFGIDGLPGDVASLSISRRDAGDRVADELDAAKLGQLLATATRNGDEVLARAVAERAVQIGAADVLDQFTQDRPALADAVQRLWTAATPRINTNDMVTLFTLATLRPGEVSRLTPSEFAELAGNAAA